MVPGTYIRREKAWANLQWVKKENDRKEGKRQG